MIVYFADRNFNILGLASNGLPESMIITDDSKVEDLESGTATFECSFVYSDRISAESMTAPGNFILRYVDDVNEAYQIISSDLDTDTSEIRVYAEDAGLDLLNTIVPAYEASEAKSIAQYCALWLTDGWTIGSNENDTATRKIKWDGESTLTERLLSIANNFDCELSYSFVVENLRVTEKKVNFNVKRGNGHADVHLALGRDIDKISIKKTNENVATCFAVTGGTKSGKAVNLKGYSYEHTDDDGEYFKVDTTTGQLRCETAIDRWETKYSDGHIVKVYTSDETDKHELAVEAENALKKVIGTEVTYECEFNNLGGAEIGDRVYIIDDAGELYLDARILSITTSVTSDTVSATLGEFVRKTSGISERLIALANQVAEAAIKTAVVKISSSQGTAFSGSSVSTVFTVNISYGDTPITDLTALQDTFGSDVSLKWYENGAALPSSDIRISAGGFTFTLTNQTMTTKTPYTCKIERA